MSKRFKGIIPCPNCKKEYVALLYGSVNVTVNPELKEKVFNEEIKEVVCSYCKHKTKVETQLLYHDMENAFALQYDPNSEIETFENKSVDSVDRGYIFSAPVIKKWSLFLSQIILHENRINLTPKHKRLQKIKQRNNIGTFEEQVKDLVDDLQLTNERCNNCGNLLKLNGLEEKCDTCDNIIFCKSPYMLEFAINVISIFVTNFNDMNVDKQEKLKELVLALDNIVDTYYLFKKIDNKDILLSIKLINELKLFGIIKPPIFYIKIENSRASIHLNKDSLSEGVLKLGNIEIISYLLGSFNYILKFI